MGQIRNGLGYSSSPLSRTTRLTVNPDTLAATLCEGMQNMASAQFPVVWSRFLEEEDPTVRVAYLYGFGCHSANRQQ